jgi:hypothetical protein
MMASGTPDSGGDHDWRLTVKFESEGHAHGVFSALKTHGAAALAAERLKDGLVAQHEEEWLRIYGSSYDALRRGQAIVASALEAEGVQAEEQAEHRVAQGAEWEPLELPPLPARDARLVDKHRGKGPWGSEADPNRVQAHFELGSGHAARAFANELAGEGYDVHHAGSFVFLFADDAAVARKLGNTLRDRAPAGAKLFFEGEGRTFFV